MNEQCILHKEMLERVEKQTGEIYSALMGTMAEPGFISQTNSRLSMLESFKAGFNKTLVWTATALFGSVIVAVVSFVVDTMK